jgi:hypothetical protein
MDGSNQRNYNADHYNIPLSLVRPEPYIPVRPELIEGRTSISNTSTLTVIPTQAGIQGIL